MRVLLSVKPKYVEAIIRGSKKYEFRRSLFKRRDVDRIYIYSTSPIKKIVGYFRVGAIVRDEPRRLWNRFGKWSGMSREDFFEYFAGSRKGFAIGIEEMQVFSVPIDPKARFPSFVPPQSFCYFDDTSL